MTRWRRGLLLLPVLLAVAGWAASATQGRPAPAAAPVAARIAGSPADDERAGVEAQLDPDEPLEPGLPWRAGPPDGTWATRPGPAPGAAGAAPAWTPATPLPAPERLGRHVDLVFTPHPDDETLSLGVWTANAAARGDRVIVVALTDGRSTGARGEIAGRLGRPVSRDEIAAARVRELRAAASRLGVAAGDLYLAHLDAESSPAGSRLTEPEAAAVIGAFAGQFPGATSATMSWVAERHPDHLNAGRALWQAVQDGTVRDAVFAVSRLWWQLPGPPATAVLPDSAQVRERVLAAAAAYGVWDPAQQRYAVGWTSVRGQFAALLADPRDRVHLWAATLRARPRSAVQPR